MINVSKITQNFANARQLFIDADYCNDHQKSFIWICVNDDSSEPMFSLFANDDGSFSYRGNIWLDRATREEIPAHIKDEKQLRQVLAFVAQDMRSQINACLN
ncbi:TPA: hypothetical protein ACG65H_003766 [Escherichia coli]|jgi:hypothetical protein|uniref:hypothetical protein n=1 Tax=Shigella sonnei TaxID=624 RepID=UPI000DA4CCDB|nr:hypothetical protein [Shigella sonnei]EBF9323889.1 hypothetical protein [Salmonella enterica]EBY5505898.1 hypothetical protein [Salmonella enterica subsp. enterica serovar Infantis]ECE8552328.1 hypothetical protein [Salmonella enterica subsp. enterica serovar Java]EDC6278301.1 hypothetical protein [Salmonella enterica subsp. enterica serovar Enteritidis]EEW1262408.1 hypothetical protein [Escherichia coli]HBI5688790.1 hypothetical protein [Salmonella enterica subsp. enterica serovar Welikad